MNRRTDELALASGLDEAINLVRAGRLAEAEECLHDLVPLDPQNAQVLGLRGMIALQTGDAGRAADLLARSLACDGPAPVMRRNIQALLTIAMSQRSKPLMECALERPVPVDDAKLRQGPEERKVIFVLAEQLAAIGCTGQALAVLQPFMPQLSDDPRFLELYGVLKLSADETQEAFAALKAAFGQGEPTSRLLLNLGTAAARADDRQTRKTATREFLKRFPLYVSEQKASQTTTIGVATWANRLIRSPNIVDFHFPFNFMSQLHRRHQDRYRIVSVLFNSPRALQAMSAAPRPDVLYNALAISEVMQKLGVKDTISTRAGIWGRPVINHPEKVLQTSRLSAPTLYAGLDGWLIPKIERYREDDDPAGLADRIEEAFDYPVIIRGLTEQFGRNMALAETRADLIETVRDVKADPYFYAIQFHESRHEDGLFRKLRAVVAGDTIQIVRVDFDTGWNIHGGHHKRRLPFDKKYPEFIQQEIEICRDADAFFGWPVMDALRAFRSRNPLDVFGIDFDVMADGRLLLFESNASMNLLSTAMPDLPAYPLEAEEAFLAGFDRFLESLKSTIG